MRFSFRSSLLLGAALVAGSAAIVNCSEPAGEEPEPTYSEDEVTGVNNRMGLKLVYDDPSSRVFATVKQKLRTGEKLLMRVRRGRLTMDSQRSLDCTQLAEAPPMPPREDAARSKIVYQGPEVDRALLASVYTQDWIDGNITPAMLDRLSRDGADSIVEACIVKDGRPRARLQTSLAYAWDESDPNAADLDVAPANVRIMAGDAGAEGEGGTTRRPRAGSPIQSMEKYAELCVAELGEIPFFKKQGDGKYDTFDCRDFVGSSGPIDGVEGAMIPQSVSDSSGVDVTPAECDDREVRRYNCYSKCDKPEWLFQSCEPGPTISTAKNSKGTHWTLLCRSVQTQDGAAETTESLKKTKRFNDIAMIGHNPKTGKTCYFQNKIHDGVDGEHVPHPADVERSRHIWDGPKGYCMGCHSAEAFIHTPWIDGALRRDGSPIVPKMGVHADFEISWNASPYSVVNRKAQANAQVGGGSWTMPQQIVSEDAEACTSCHRIGAGQGMRRFPMWAVGEEGLDTFTQGTSGPIQGRLSDHAKKFENSHWMPPRLNGLTEATWPQSKYAAAVAHIKKCAEDATAAGCAFADIPEKP